MGTIHQRAGEWVRAIGIGANNADSSGDDEWRELRSLTDLRWEMTQAAQQQGSKQ